MDEDELAFLRPGFDLNTLKVANLRNILVRHDVPFPSSAKKPELMQIVTEEILPQRKKLLSAQARVKRTSRGIVDVPSSQESTVADDDAAAAAAAAENTTADVAGNADRKLMPPPQTPKKGRGSRSGAKGMDGAGDEETGAGATSSRRTGRTPSRKSAAVKHARESDTDDIGGRLRAPSRKSRKSEMSTPAAASSSAVKIEEPEEGKKQRYSGENFSSDNPFQSGSSPPADRGSSSKSRKRRSSISVSREERRKNGNRDRDRDRESRGRMTLSPGGAKVKQEDGIEVPTRSTFEVPLAKLKSQKYEETSDGIEAGEEFTPEEQLELVRTRAEAGYQDLLPPRRKAKKANPVAKSAPWVVIMTLLAVFAGYWRNEKIAIGYCGVGKPNWSLTETKLPEWFHTLQPECEPCPPHAYCHANLEARCEQDFILRPHPLSLGGLIPLPPTCEPDSEKEKRVQAVAERAVNELRERRAKYECGELKDEKGKTANLDIPPQELKKEVASKRRKGMTDLEFQELWEGALGEILTRDEVVSGTDGAGNINSLASTSLARIPLGCALKRSVRLTLARYRLQLGGVILFIYAIFSLRSRIRERRSDAARIPDLVSLTLDRLATQASLHSMGKTPEGFISVGQLRDDVLRGEFSAKRREKVWKGVREVVEDNSNVRAAVREGRSGEVSRVWEWIGETQNLPLEGRRQSGRISWGIGDDSLIGEEKPQREMEMRKWDEGRPIF